MKFRRINTLTKTTIDRDKTSEETFQDFKQAIEKFLEFTPNQGLYA